MARKTPPGAKVDTRPTRTPEQRARDSVRIMGLRDAGWLQEEIAQELGVSQQQVSYDILQMRRAWQERAAIDVEGATGRELARLDYIEEQAGAAWLHSLEDARTTRTVRREWDVTVPVKRRGTDGMVEETREKVGMAASAASVSMAHSAGNPAYLIVIVKCVEQRAKLLGLNKPERIKVSGEDDAPTPVLDLHNVTREELGVLRRLKARH